MAEPLRITEWITNLIDGKYRTRGKIDADSNNLFRLYPGFFQNFRNGLSQYLYIVFRMLQRPFCAKLNTCIRKLNIHHTVRIGCYMPGNLPAVTHVHKHNTPRLSSIVNAQHKAYIHIHAPLQLLHGNYLYRGPKAAHAR
ncbi:hypothetical protein D3C77_631950 [compost metagenome]